MRITGRMVLGLVVMMLGAFWTFDNLNILESEPILRWWPAALVLVGLAKLLGIGTAKHPVAGIVLTLAGAWLLADSLDLMRATIWDLWPVGLILLGLHMLTRSMRGQRHGGLFQDVSSHLNAFAFLSGLERKAGSQEFRGGEVTAVMGGGTIDMRGAKPVPEGAVIDLFVWWGGIELIVPDHWSVVSEATVLLGAIEDKSRTPPPDSRDILVVRGLVVMGGVEIKN